jgi:hypothetical protein
VIFLNKKSGQLTSHAAIGPGADRAVEKSLFIPFSYGGMVKNMLILSLKCLIIKMPFLI